MVSLQAIRESNARIGTSLQPGLVAVFVGATSGIGEGSLKEIAKRAQRPRIYFLGRRESEGNRIKEELTKINGEGEYHFLQYDLSLLKNVDDACHYIRDREPAINLLFLASGTLVSGKRKYGHYLSFEIHIS
jgi:NADP-dependent 3-hydroxy acid dehydrogenase YdfG